MKPDLMNVTTAMKSAYRFSHKRPFMRWALAPDFCSALHPLLVEEQSTTFFLAQRWLNFTSCERIRQIVRESFDVWSAANPNLHFVDVTDRCAAENMWVPMPSDRCAESNYCVELENATVVDWQEEPTPLEELPNPQTWLCSHRTCFECDRADVIIGGFTQKNRRLGDQHAAARVQRTSLSDARPLAPSGRAAEGKTIFRAFMEFNVDDVYKNTDSDPNGQGNITLDNCWRLDNDVCDYVIGLEVSEKACSETHAARRTQRRRMQRRRTQRAERKPQAQPRAQAKRSIPLLGCLLHARSRLARTSLLPVLRHASLHASSPPHMPAMSQTLALSLSATAVLSPPASHACKPPRLHAVIAMY